MNRATLDLEDIDQNMRALVVALNEFPGVRTMGSCGGHRNPSPIQKPYGEWFVSFDIAYSTVGRRSLEFLLWAINNVYAPQVKRGSVAMNLADVTVSGYEPEHRPKWTEIRAPFVWWSVNGKNTSTDELAHFLGVMRRKHYGE